MVSCASQTFLPLLALSHCRRASSTDLPMPSKEEGLLSCIEPLLSMLSLQQVSQQRGNSACDDVALLPCHPVLHRSHGALLLLQPLLTAAESLAVCQTDPHLLAVLESRLPRLSLLAMSIGLVDSICSGVGETELCK